MKDEWSELEALALLASSPREKHADHLSAYADWLKFADKATPAIVLTLITEARIAKELEAALQEIEPLNREGPYQAIKAPAIAGDALTRAQKMREGG